MNRPVFLAASAAMAFLIGAGAAETTSAQPLCHTYNSLEWLVAHSDLVVRASVAEVATAPSQGQQAWKIVTLKVHETLKGDAAKALTFAEENSQGSMLYERWKDAALEGLWFLVRNKEHDDSEIREERIAARYPLKLHGDGWSMVCLRPPVAGQRDLPPPIYGMQLETLSEAKEILKATKTAAAGNGKRETLRGHTIGLPLSCDRLRVPVDSRLEKLARRLIKSPDDYLQQELRHRPEGEDKRRLWESGLRNSRDFLRAEGAKALVYFPSDENIKILKLLLEDPACWHPTMGNDGESAAMKREYYVRHEACVTLLAWGVKVDQPLLEEWVPRDQVLRKADLPKAGDAVGRPDSKVVYFFSNRFRTGSAASPRTPPGLYRSEDDGSTWRLWCIEFEFERLFMHPKTGVLYASVETPRLTHDADGFLHARCDGRKAVMSVDGKRWKDITPGSGEVPAILEFIVDPDNPQRVCVYTGYRTGGSTREQMAYVLQSKDDGYSQWISHLAEDFEKRGKKQP
jgi:hypothetical protein